MMIKTYRITLTALTPVFIGGGNDASLNRSQYIFDREKNLVYFLDEAKFIKFLQARKLFDEYMRYVEKVSHQGQNPNANPLHLSEWLAQKNMKDFSRLASGAVELETPDRQPSDLNDIKCFIRTGLNQPYIPGSSIKGAWRGTIISYHIKKNNKQDEEWGKMEKRLLDLRNPEAKEVNKIIREYRIEKHYLRLDDKEGYSSLNDAFRFFSVSDSMPFKNDDFFISRSLRLSAHKKNGTYL